MSHLVYSHHQRAVVAEGDSVIVMFDYQAQRPRTMYPRLGARFEYSTGRERTLYGFQLEQPLLPTARFVFGVSMVRRTDHSELQQVDDVENSLALLLARTDYRDYFERIGGGGAVLGSKKLKAIVVSGTLRPSHRDKAKLADAGLRWRDGLRIPQIH